VYFQPAPFNGELQSGAVLRRGAPVDVQEWAVEFTDDSTISDSAGSQFPRKGCSSPTFSPSAPARPGGGWLRTTQPDLADCGNGMAQPDTSPPRLGPCICRRNHARCSYAINGLSAAFWATGSFRSWVAHR
jgi:hypothetical protein